ncbi:RNA polymerase sigma factor [Piscinibacter sakaiensis]|uniref:RNA polymerase sigma factor n=1 Tax=Piscinibacter sakaiensis TaxID=1547922 RepID=UPI003AB05F68
MASPRTEWSTRSEELAQLLARAGLGDRAAFATLYQRSSAHLFAVILRINRDKAQAEDILQEVFVNVWRAAAGFDSAQSQPMTWLTSIARNRAIDSLRRTQTQPQLHSSHRGPDDEEHDVYETTADDSPGPLDLLNRSALARGLERCLEGLAAPQRQSLALAYFDGLSHGEIAARMAQPLGTVKSWVRRGLQALKPCLDDAGFGRED